MKYEMTATLQMVMVEAATEDLQNRATFAPEEVLHQQTLELNEPMGIIQIQIHLLMSDRRNEETERN